MFNTITVSKVYYILMIFCIDQAEGLVWTQTEVGVEVHQQLGQQEHKQQHPQLTEAK